MAVPNDSNSLLVPVYLDAWAIDNSTQQGIAWYYANYGNLAQFQSPIPNPFDVSTGNKPAVGIHLHWALPDALTNAVQNSDGSFSFPLVPNRWLVVRFSGAGSSWAMNAWVVQSDYVSTSGSGTSAFLDPSNPSGISNDGSTVTVNQANIGTSYTVQAWQTQGDPGGNSFLQAVGPGNISFAAYKPFSENVFSFIDGGSDLPAQGPFSYLVTGWYSDAANEDPLRGINTWLPNIWPSQSDWQNQTVQQRFTTLMSAMNWSLPDGTSAPNTPPAASLYHGFIADVTWPFGTVGPPVNDFQVAVGNTAADALAALIQNYASVQAQTYPAEQAAWLTAGQTLCSLIQAAMFELLDDYGKPGGTALVQQQVEQSWFGSDPGGTVWKVVSTTAQSSAFNITDNSLTPEQNAALVQQLAALNEQQAQYDVNQRTLQSKQGELYRLWLKISQAQNYGWGETPTTVPDFSSVLQPVMQNNLYPDQFNDVWTLCCKQASSPALLQNPSDTDGANAWANSNWSFPATPPDTGTVNLAALGLELKASTAPRFWHPSDPVLMVCGAGRTVKHGQDGIYNSDNTLTCRLPSQTITGLNANGQPAVTAAAVAAKVQFNQLQQYTAVPAIPSLLTEAFFCDPLNAPIMASAVSGTNATVLQNTITQLLDDSTSAGTWQGTPPSPLAYSSWSQAWSPLFLEWMVNYYPTVSDTQGDYTLNAWNFDGSNYAWNGSGINPGGASYSVSLSGRTVVTPYAQNVLQDKLSKYLSGHPEIDSQQLDQLLNTVMGWDILSQSLSGFTDQLITLLSQETFPPPGTGDALPCPPVQNPATPPKVGALVQEQYHLMPVLQGDGNNHNFFFPVRGGLVTFPKQHLQIVDAYGQTLDLTKPNTTQGFIPLISPSLTPPSGIKIPPGITGPFVLGPRLEQSTRLNMILLANDNTGNNIVTSANDNPVCGWLLPNHLDNSIAVYDSDGNLLGEIWPLPAPDNWRPRPGPAGTNPPPATPANIQNVALKNVVSSLAAQSAAVLQDFMTVVDETLWMSDPLGGRTDAFLSALIGRPLAVVQLEMNIELNGDVASNQFWNFMLTPDSTTSNFKVVEDTGAALTTSFPVRLGSLDLRNDGLMGYYQTTTVGSVAPYGQFYTVHTSPTLSANDTYIKPILNTSGSATVCQGDISLLPNGASTTVTMILDPRGCVHGYTGVLPVNSTMIDGPYVQRFIRQMLVNFQTGPILSDPGALRTPQPAEQQGTWDWLQNISGNWQQNPIIDTTDAARFPTQAPVLREGWLQLSGLNNDNSSNG